MQSVSTVWLWAGFFIFVFIVLAIDFCLLNNRKSHKVTTQEALRWTLIWVSCALTFNLILWLYLKQTQGPLIAGQKAMEFLTGYLIEESLSFDNMFVFLMIFNLTSLTPYISTGSMLSRVIIFSVI